jgi:apolipoprotein N-acyltransferase
MTKKNSLIIALSSGILMGCTTAPINAWPLAWIALSPLWILLVKNRKSLPRNPSKNALSSLFFLPSSFWFLTLLWGIGYHGLALSWIRGIHPMTWLGVPWLPSLGITIFCWSAIALWGTLLVVIWGYLFLLFSPPLLPREKLDNSSPYPGAGTGAQPLLPNHSTNGQRQKNSLFSAIIRVLIGTALWCLLESIWSSSVLWWTSLSYTQSPHNLVILHLAQLSGPNTITATIVAVNGLIAESFIGGRRKRGEGRGKKEEGRGKKEEGNFPSPQSPVPFFAEISKNEEGKLIPDFRLLSVAFCLCLLLHLIGLSLYSRPLDDRADKSLKIGVIQGNIPNEIKFDSRGWRQALEGYTQGYEKLVSQGVDAVLIPETALPFIWTNEYERQNLSFYQAILDKQVMSFVGGFGQRDRALTNSLFAINGAGNIISHYDKIKLVPLGEYIPFEEWLGRLINRLSPLDSHLVGGDFNQIFETPWGRAIVGICYDSAFTELFRNQAAKGGLFILTASNDAHYTTSMMVQHHSQDIIRAIETDRWEVRATNTGLSAFVNPHGETLWISQKKHYEVEANTIYRRDTKTLYVRYGDWLTSVLLLFSVGVWGFLLMT